MKNIVKLIIAGIFFCPLIVMAEEVISESEIDLNSIKYHKSKQTAEIKMTMYNKNYQPGIDDMYYAIYYLKMFCGQNMYKPLIIEGYDQNNKLLLVDYEKYTPQEIIEDSDIAQAYGFACRYTEIPKVNKRKNQTEKLEP